MDGDAKATGLKSLQGLIWKSGFESGEMRAHVYEDVVPAIDAWKAAGRDVRIYSSGSIAAQKLFFGHSEQGDLLDRFSGHYDTTSGGKKEQGSYTIWWGYGNSPVLHQNALITVCMQDALADKQEKRSPSYVIAHDVRDGHVRWRVDRKTKAKGEQGDSYTTPLLIGDNARRQLVIMGANQLDSYNPNNGKQIWLIPNLVGARTITGPTIAAGMIYTTVGGSGALLAVRPPNTNKPVGKLRRQLGVILQELGKYGRDHDVGRALRAVLAFERNAQTQFGDRPAIHRPGGRLLHLPKWARGYAWPELRPPR